MGIHWGRKKESGIWLGRAWRLRCFYFKHDAFYLSVGRLRLRIMKEK